MKTKLLLTGMISAFILNVYCQSDNFQSEKLVKLWEVKGMEVPESVQPVLSENKIYVSNIASPSPVDKDSTGYISILSFDGKILTQKWATGLNAPKGMGIIGGSLFVTDIDRIAEIDLKTGKIIKFYAVDGAQFLNDIAVTSEDILFITDSKAKKVYKFDHGKISTVVESDDYPFLNGIIFADRKILVGTGKNIISIDPKTDEAKAYIENTGGIDGFAQLGPKNYIFSDWSGIIHCIEEGKEKELLLDTSKLEKTQSADFGYCKEKNTIYVPTFFGNSIVCYQLKDK